MAFELIKAEILELADEMQNKPEDAHELYLKLERKLSELRAFGMPIPDDLLKLEAQLQYEFAADLTSNASAKPGDGDNNSG